MSKSNNIIWPLSLRLIHWFIALFVLLDAFWIEDALHRYLGYAALFLVLIRIYQGFFGKGYVLFSSMPIGIKTIWNFLENHFIRKAHYEGHNPLASLVYYLMWIIIIALAITGWMLGLDAYWGDEYLSNIHVWLSNSLIVLVVFHLLGLLLDSYIYKRKSWMGMIDGKAK